MTPLDPDRLLALSYVPARVREAVRTLWQLDAQLGSVLAGGRERAISQIKLAWWREALEKLDRQPPPAEPTLQAVARHILPGGISGAELAGLEAGWAVLVQEEALEPEDLQAYAEGRGALLFALTARLLGAKPTARQLRSGEAWALADLSRHSGEPDAGSAVTAASERLQQQTWPSMLRPLGMLAVLSERDVKLGPAREVQGSPGRIWRMLRHRLTGR